MASSGAPGGRKHSSAVPAALLLLLTACLLVLFGIVQNYSAQTQRLHASEAVAPDANATAAALAAAHASNQVLQQLVQQVSALNKSVPQLVQQALHEHHQKVASAVAAAAQKPPAVVPLQPVEVPVADHQVHHVGRARSACDKQGGAGIKLDAAANSGLVAPVVIVAHNRVHYLAHCLMTVLKYWSEDEGNARRFPLFVSVDGGHTPTMAFASALNFGANVQLIKNVRDSSRCKQGDGYCNLSVHYQMLLQLFLECLNAPRVLFIEEDLEVAPDFFSYFTALAPVMDGDASVLCVSAWNDHGQRGRAANGTALYRTDIFPGLGWMTTAAVGKELFQKWPDVYWDDWLREPTNRRGRQCIFPEVARTHTFGRAGTSGGQFFDAHLSNMAMNKEPIDWSKQDLTYLQRDAYAQLMAGWVSAAEPIQHSTVGAYCALGQPDEQAPRLRADLVVTYQDAADYTRLATQLKPMLTDTKGGKLPRASYDGIVTVRCRGRRLFIAPARKPQPAAAGAGADAAAAAGAAAADPAAHAAGAATKVGR